MREHILFALIGICLTLVLFTSISDVLPRRRKQLLLSMTLSVALLLVAVELANIYNGTSDPIEAVVLKLSKFTEYYMNLVITFIFCRYLKDILDTEVKTVKSLKIAEYALILGTGPLIVSQPIGLYYTYGSDNLYRRSPAYAMSYIPPIVAIVFLIFTIIKYREKLRKRLFVPLLLFTATPILSSIVHLIVLDSLYTNATIVGMVVVLYCFSILDANDLARLARQRQVELVNQTAFALVEAIDAKDSYTNGHSRRVAEYSVMIAEQAGKSSDELDNLYMTALLHDVGKIGIPGSIINKPGKLTDEEFALIKTHPVVGREILSKITICPELAIGANFHHERYDGKGYPCGLKGTEIPETARIIAVADAYDAMASKRSYRDVLPREKIREEFISGAGKQFDPKFADIMVRLIDQDVDYHLREE